MRQLAHVRRRRHEHLDRRGWNGMTQCEEQTRQPASLSRISLSFIVGSLALLTAVCSGLACGGSDSGESPEGAAKRFFNAWQRSDAERYLASIDPDLRDRPAKETAALILRDIDPLRSVAAGNDRFEVRGLKIARVEEAGEQATIRVSGTVRNLTSISETAFSGTMGVRRVEGKWIATEWLPGTKYPSNGNTHLAQLGQAHGAYFSNPPSSGWHLPPVPRPGVYTQSKAPEEIPHFLEHGGIWVLYSCPGGCSDLVQSLQRIVNRSIDAGKPVALSPYPATGSQAPARRINVVAWQRVLGQDEPDADAIQGFIDAHACRYNPEGGPYCSGVRGTVDPEQDAGDQGFNARR
jgi:hypothetical protein